MVGWKGPEFIGEWKMKQIANVLTGCRILGSILLLFFPTFSLGFYVTYVLCGLSDMVDGAIARRTNSISRFGSQLDTVADMVFVIASLIKILPAIDVPLWLWMWGGAIALIKVGNIIWGYVARRQFVSIHTIMNKVTGFILFLLPLTLSFMELDFAAMVVCLIATISAIQEGFLIIGFFRS